MFVGNVLFFVKLRVFRGLKCSSQDKGFRKTWGNYSCNDDQIPAHTE